MMKFVEFAQELTYKPLVKRASEQLQSYPQLNINLILYALWHGASQRGRLSQQDIKTLLQAIHPWHERIFLALKRLAPNELSIQKKLAKELAQELAIEINVAEQFEWHLIEGSLFKLNYQKRSNIQQLNDACYNVLNYCKTIHVPINREEQNAIIKLLQATFPNLIHSKIIKTSEIIFNAATIENNRNFSQLSLEEF